MDNKQQDMALEQIENELMAKVESLRYIVTGLENHDPYLKLVEIWRKTEEDIDHRWHLIDDPKQLILAKGLKFSARELVTAIENMRNELVRYEVELAKLRNPDVFEDKYGG
jgi:hypothetical protein